jgi:hypothetical protein
MKKWKEYYLECKDIYNKETKIDNSNISIYDLSLQINPSPTDQTYFDQISLIKNKLDVLYQDKINYTNTSGISLSLKDSFNVSKELKIIVDNYLVPYLEKNIFGCYVQCQNVKIYKTISESLIETSSWLWHFDNNPKEQIKVMIYLNDVNDNGPFKFLSKNNKAIKINPQGKKLSNTRPNQFWAQNWFEVLGEKWKGDRIPRSIISNLKEKYNYKEIDVKGPAGTSILFDNNIVHKGTIPVEGFRYAMTLQFQPINKKLNPNFSKENTGNGWGHNLFSPNPESPIIKKLPS